MYFNKIHGIRISVITAIIIAMVSGCGIHTSRMDFVSQNVEEDRIVSRDAVADPDILNQYRHHYSVTDKEMAVFIELDRARIPASGGEVYAQIGIVARPEKRKPANIHLYVYDENYDTQSNRLKLQKLVEQLTTEFDNKNQGGKLTVDTSFTRPDWVKPAQLFDKQFSDLEAVLRKLTQSELSNGRNHFVFVMGDLTRPDKKARQDMVDLARLLKIKGATLSIINTGEKPDFNFLDTMSSRGDGHLAFNNEYLSISDWVSDELQFISAQKYKDMQIVIQTENNIEITEILSPKNIRFSRNKVEAVIPSLTSGVEMVYLARLKVPPMKPDMPNGLLAVNLEYFQPQQKRFNKARYQTEIRYSLDKNECMPNTQGNVARSLLILDTHKAISDSARAINQKRNYQAIALLMEQVQRLREFNTGKNDSELARDADIMTRYSNNIYEFQDKAFQGIRVWKDTVWDQDRYTTQYY